MRYAEVKSWALEFEVPEKYRGPGPHEISNDELEQLMEIYDIMVRSDGPSRRTAKQGVEPSPRTRVLFLSRLGRAFNQR